MASIFNYPPISAICGIASSEVIIVSNDTDFDAVVSFWAEKGMNIRRQSINPHGADKKRTNP